MRTHTQRAHWHGQDTIAKTLLTAAHAKRLAAQGRLPYGRWATYRWRAIAARWGEALLTMQARARRSLPLTYMLLARRPEDCPRPSQDTPEQGSGRAMTIFCQKMR